MAVDGQERRRHLIRHDDENVGRFGGHEAGSFSASLQQPAFKLNRRRPSFLTGRCHSRASGNLASGQSLDARFCGYDIGAGGAAPPSALTDRARRANWPKGGSTRCLPIRPGRLFSSATRIRTSRILPEDPAAGKILLADLRHEVPAARRGGPQIRSLDRRGSCRSARTGARRSRPRLRACDIFVLLVSTNSTGSDYIVDKEIPIIRERQKSDDGRPFLSAADRLDARRPGSSRSKTRTFAHATASRSPVSAKRPQPGKCRDAADEIADIAKAIEETENRGGGRESAGPGT